MFFSILFFDRDSIIELTEYTGLGGEAKKIDSKAKAAFTRTYNGGNHMLPYAEKGALPKRAASSAPVDCMLLSSQCPNRCHIFI